MNLLGLKQWFIIVFQKFAGVVKMPQKIISLVIVNLHGTLVNTPQIAYEAYRQALAEIGVILTAEEYKEFIGGASKTKMADILAKKTIVKTTEEISALNQRKDEIYDSLLTKDIKIASVVAALNEFAKAKIRIVLASNTPIDRIQHVISATGVTTSFDRIFSADDFKSTTADSRHNFIAAQMGVEPNQCLVIEDAKGIKEAANSGMFVVGVKGKDATIALNSANLIIDHNDTSWHKDLIPTKAYSFLHLFNTRTALATLALATVGAAVYYGVRNFNNSPAYKP